MTPTRAPHPSAARLTVLRVLLDPVTSWQAYRLVRQAPQAIDFDTAWRRIRLLRHPDEVGYLRYGHSPPTQPTPQEHPSRGTGDVKHRRR